MTKVRINIISFTNEGINLSKHIYTCVTDIYDVRLFTKYSGHEKEIASADNQGEKKTDSMMDSVVIETVEESISDWTLDMQNQKEPIIFIGAMGIAVRSIADGIKDKLTDAPVIVIDEKGRFVIPVVAGHVGGANELANVLAQEIGAIPVITTATDIEGAFSVDVWARENNLAIMNREGIVKVSTKALEGKPVRICIENYPSEDESDCVTNGSDISDYDDTKKNRSIDEKRTVLENKIDVIVTTDIKVSNTGSLILCPKRYALGIGCRRGTDSTKLSMFVREILSENDIDTRLIGAIGSIDIKKDEQAIIDLSQELSLPFITFTAELLQRASGNFEESSFVKEKTGVGNVCERAAMLLCNNRGKVVISKTAQDGMTLALYEAI